MDSTSLIDMFAISFQMLRLTWPVWLLLGVITLGRLLRKSYLNRQFKQAGMINIDRYTGIQFEQYLQFLFQQLGYTTQGTPVRGDFGADLIVEKDGIRTAVQAKCFNGTVGLNAVQQVVAAMPFYECNRAIVVTNSYFSQAAQELANANHVELWDRKRLTKMILASHALESIPPQLRIIEPSRISDLNATTPSLLKKPIAQPEAQPTESSCKICGQPVTPGVRRYCLEQPNRFGGNVYCIQHQRQFKDRSKLPIPTSG
ncbi:MAG: restriction endonuclease [Caldilineaceae bacterium]|nr:restriction endonuclease [Caldilineaceae bacterium]